MESHLSNFDCPKCGAEMVFSHTDYYDFDVYKCPDCGNQIELFEDDYLDDESLRSKYGDDYFEEDSY